MITKEQLVQITGKPKIVERIFSHLISCLEKYEINNYLRICHFLSQVLHESGCFVYFKEIASGSAYEGRRDLGNTQPGDGKKYKGRGVIQITGRSNYDLLSKEFKIDFLKNPELLENDEWGIKSAGWFWNSKKLNLLADQDNILSITKKINGGTNGLSDRQMWLDKCKNIIRDSK